MGICDVCGNNYGKSFEVITRSGTYTFDCLECAIQAIAPECAHCGCRIIGHGVEAGDNYYCCAHCAQASGITDIRDHSALGTDTYGAGPGDFW